MRLLRPLLRKVPLWAAVPLAAVLGALLFELCFVWGGPWLQQFHREQALLACRSVPADDNQIECIFRVISAEMKAHGVEAAMQVFAQAYEMSEPFVSGGCHRQAHRMGDLAYYGTYIGREDMDAMEFPQSTTACGYGFFHGFLEHLIQDHPDPAFVDRTCAYLTKRLGTTMGDIRLTCYHGSGHGFVLSQIESLKKADWGNLRKFSDHPYVLCGELKGASDIDREQCYEGIFNVIVDAMSDGAYGFSYNYEHPFWACDALPRSEWRACYYEMSQKLDRPSHNDPVQLSALAAQGKTEALQMMAFRTGIAGVIQQVIGDGDEYKGVLERCGLLSDALYKACMGSVVNGLYEHGDPQKEYEKALTACTDPSVAAHNAQELCYHTVSIRLPRFYDDTKITEICTEYPQQYQALCTAELGKHDPQGQ